MRERAKSSPEFLDTRAGATHRDKPPADGPAAVETVERDELMNKAK